MFEGFEERHIDVGSCSLFVRYGGEGPPVLLLHGHPRTSATWHRVAPQLLNAGFSVVCPDLPGYGQSSKPAPTVDHAAHSKRATARHMVALMVELGHEQFRLVGHDRGSYTALRLVLDYPGTVSKVALLDCIPISEHLARADARFATKWWHWFFYAQPDIPERVIMADPDSWYGGSAAAMGQENYDEWRRAIHNPDTVRAMLEDYRAGVTIDRQHEEADRQAGRAVTVPLLLLWSLRDDLVDLYGDPLRVWERWATDVRGHGIESGHHMAEEAPDELSSALLGFL
ncbi:alpha/beta hydrolase [Arthrobacter sp. M2012083]|uniref:alpha/beta fold hydrolase n=1 Tax=Arthrobacter sp. M2012083 TaxID=1197706 RepID=UPI0002F23945|nr:alpha/beta hydrolase [Arthrobacter sp. M2012083]